MKDGEDIPHASLSETEATRVEGEEEPKLFSLKDGRMRREEATSERRGNDGKATLHVPHLRQEERVCG